jgi:hypothetical protein
LPPIRVIAVKLGALNSVSETSETWWFQPWRG